MWINWKFYKKMSARIADKWRKADEKRRKDPNWKSYGEWIKSNYKSYKTQIEMQKLERMPDPGQHQTLSFIKSGIRIIGYLCLPFSIIAATVLLIASEVVGIAEELV